MQPRPFTVPCNGFWETCVAVDLHGRHSDSHEDTKGILGLLGCTTVFSVFMLDTDASDRALGAAVSQIVDGEERLPFEHSPLPNEIGPLRFSPHAGITDTPDRKYPQNATRRDISTGVTQRTLHLQENASEQAQRNPKFALVVSMGGVAPAFQVHLSALQCEDTAVKGGPSLNLTSGRLAIGGKS